MEGGGILLATQLRVLLIRGGGGRSRSVLNAAQERCRDTDSCPPLRWNMIQRGEGDDNAITDLDWLRDGWKGASHNKIKAS